MYNTLNEHYMYLHVRDIYIYQYYHISYIHPKIIISWWWYSFHHTIFTVPMVLLCNIKHTLLEILVYAHNSFECLVF